MRVLVSGGGTAGHIYPALTVAEHAIGEERSEVSFVGVPDSLEARLASEAGLDFIGVRASGWDRARPSTLVTAGGTISASLGRCLRILRTTRADVVIGFGGYVSLPLGLAAAFAGVPLVLHEQNSVPGVANRLLGRWARTVCVTYPESIQRLPRPSRALVTGNPVRPSILTADGDAGRAALGLAKKDVVLLVFGGSRGARHLNAALVSLARRLEEIKGLRIIHIAGEAEHQQVVSAVEQAFGGAVPAWWQVHPYLQNMGDALAAADLAVCRAGATTIAELTTLGVPAVLVPYPYATDDHQTGNARPLAEAGAAVVFADESIDEPAFADALLGLLRDRPARRRMSDAAIHLAHPYAAHAVVEAALEAACAHSPWRHTRAPVEHGNGPAPRGEEGSETPPAPPAGPEVES